MYKSTVFNCHIFFWLFIIAYIIISCTAFTCIHDEVIHSKIPSTDVRSTKYQDIRAERARNASFFEPLQVYFYIDDFDTSLSTNVIYNIEIALKKIREYISETFQVRKRRRPFILTREGCTQTWQFGKNKGKCSKFKAEIEICSSKEIDYQIPQRYLDRLEVYGFDSPRPIYGIPPGTGLLDSNFIIFVTNRPTSTCEGNDILAYGTYCRLDQRTSEPHAGLLNLCPNYFAHKVYSSQHYYNVLLHELFHILGFSFHLFDKFLSCEKGIQCSVPKNIVIEDSNNIGRLVYPLVVTNMRHHFNCSDEEIDFGAPMDVQTEEDNSTGNVYSSHWHPVLMYSSIMTPKFSEYDDIFVDNITLAVFASTGWYRVNFSKADNFRFGKGQGCDFGLDDNCRNSTYLCDPSTNETSCDLMFRTIGKCMQVVSHHPCGIFQPRSEEICESEEENYGLDFYALNYKQKCFLFEESETVKPMCLPIKCQSNNTYMVFINRTWELCQSEEWMHIDDKKLLCPFITDFCTESSVPFVQSHCTEDNHFSPNIMLSAFVLFSTFWLPSLLLQSI